MMKKIYRVLLIFTLVSLFFTTYIMTREIVSSGIPNIKETIVIETSSGEKNTKELYQEIQHYAKENGIDIHKIVFQIGDEGENHKNIFTFSKKGFSDYSYRPLSTDDPTNFYDASELTTEDPFAGFYALTENAPATIVEDFYNMGMEIQHEPAGIFRYLIFGVFLKTGNLFIVLVFCTITALLFYKFSQRKKVGILQILGQRPAKIVFIDMIFDFSILLTIALVFSLWFPLLFSVFLWLSIGSFFVILVLNIVLSWFAYTIGTISDKIKGRKPYQKLNIFNSFLKIVLFVFIILNTTSLITQQAELKQLTEQLFIWQSIPNYYRLDFSVGTSLMVDLSKNREEQIKESEEINERLLPLLELSEKSGGLLVQSNEFGRNELAVSYVHTLPFLTANHNYLEVTEVMDSKGRRIQNLSKNSFYVLIPENEKKHEKLIIEEVEKELQFNQNFFEDISEKFRGELKILYTKSGQQLFNYDHEWPSLSISTDPVIIILDLGLIQPNLEVWRSRISTGNYLFKNPEEVQNFIAENDMEKDFFSLTAVKDSVYQELQQARSDYFLTWVLLVLLFLSFIAIELYITLVYFEANKKRLFLRFIFGDSFFSRYGIYFLSVTGISAAAGMTLMIWRSELMPWILFFLVFESLLLMFTTWITEKRMRLEVIKND